MLSVYDRAKGVLLKFKTIKLKFGNTGVRSAAGRVLSGRACVQRPGMLSAAGRDCDGRACMTKLQNNQVYS